MTATPHPPAPPLRRLAVLVMVALLLATVMASPTAHAEDPGKEWQLGFLRAEDAWRYSKGDSQIVAVIDSGVDAAHPDLQGQVLPGADFVDGSTDGRTDVVGHGTTVAGLIAGRADGRGVEGLAPRARILPVRVLDPNNQYDSAENIAKAVRWAVDHGATVVNLSLGSAETAPVLSAALMYALDRDVVVVACNGNLSNERGTKVWHPAREPGVIAVSGVNPDGSFWGGSLSGPETVLAAPATEITGARPGGSTWTVQGTSFAAPLVSAAAALVRGEHPGMSAANVVNRLIRTAWDFGPMGHDSQFGYGIVNPARALAADITDVARNPLLAPERGNAGAGEHDVGPSRPAIATGDGHSGGSVPLAGIVILLGVGVVMLVAAAGLGLVTRRREARAWPGPAPDPPSHTAGCPPPWSPPRLPGPPEPPPPR